MATVKPFKCIRPRTDIAHRVAALPYDVYNREEAYDVVQKEELSFLKIDRAETQFDNSVDPYDDIVYEIWDKLFELCLKDNNYKDELARLYQVALLSIRL